MSETHSNAYKLEAAEKRRQAANLLAEAEELDPTPQPKEKKAKVNRSAKSGKFVNKEAVKKSPDTTVSESK